jgi:coenzyme F420 hydrogenase subunit delta
MYPDWYGKTVLIFGCGNILFGDDGFGPAVAKYLQENFVIPGYAYVVDAGTGVREILFDILLSDKKPDRIIIIDSMDIGKEAGTICRVSVDDLPVEKTDDFSLHQIPSSNLLRELSKLSGIDVIIFSCQPKYIPKEVATGLSEPVKEAVPKVCKLIYDTYLSGNPVAEIKS